MKIFLTYASEQKYIAEPIALSLRSRGHHVFLDKDDLPPGRSYDEQIETAIKGSDYLLFLVSPESVTPGRYTLTELEFARHKWRTPDGHVLPIMAVQTAIKAVPDYLRAVTILEPKGNIAAEVASQITETNEISNRRLFGYLIAAAILSGLLSVGTNWLGNVTLATIGLGVLTTGDDTGGAQIGPGLWFGLAISAVLFFRLRIGLAKALVAFIVIQIAWHLAYRTTATNINALQLQVGGAPDASGNRWLATPSVFLGGLIGAFGTWAAAALATVRLRYLESAVLTTVIGGVAAVMVLLLTQGYFFQAIYLIWQPLVATSLAYGLWRYR